MKEIVFAETERMIQSFMIDFFIPYMKKNLQNVPQEEIANIFISFAQSIFITLMQPIFEVFPVEDQNLDHIIKIIDIIEENSFVRGKLQKNKTLLN